MVLLGAVCTLAFPARPAHAQSVAYRNVPVGERAIGMGGAFTGLADDTSAAYYNPAGLAWGYRAQLSGSLSLFAFGRTRVEDGLVAPNGTADFTSKMRRTVPPFAGAAFQFGKKKWGEPRYAFAYSTLQPDRLDQFFDVSIQDPDSEASVRVGTSYRLSLHGVSFAARVASKVSLGVSLYLGVQKQGYGESVALASGGTFDADGNRVNADSLVASSVVDVSAFHFVLRIGGLYRLGKHWKLGAMLQFPGIPLKQNGRLRRQESTFDATSGQSTFFLADESELDAHIPIPFELRVGASFSPKEVTTFALDLSLHGFVRDRELVAIPTNADIIGSEAGVFYSNSTRRNLIGNVALGAEHDFGKLSTQIGVFTNLSAAPKVPATSQTYTPARIHMIGGTAAIGFKARDYRLSTGVTALWGKGNALAATVNQTADVLGYQQTSATRRAFLFHISGAVSAVSRAAGDVITTR